MIIASVDGDFTVKTYRRDKDGVRLEPANPNYPVIRLRPGQGAPEDPIGGVGVVE